MVFSLGSASTVTDWLIHHSLGSRVSCWETQAGVERRRVNLEPLSSHLGWLAWLEAQLRGLCHLNQGDP